MNSNVHNLLRETVPLLREVSTVLRAKSETSAAQKIDEAATAIEVLMQTESVDRLSINEILHGLGEGVALVASLADLLKVFA